MRLRTILAGAVAALALAVPASASACTSVTDQLSLNKASIEVTCLPAGTDHVGVAVMQTTAGAGLKEGINIPTSQKVYPPPAATPVVSLSARTASGSIIGSWTARLVTVPGGAKSAELEAAERQLTLDQAKQKQLEAELTAERSTVALDEVSVTRLKEAAVPPPPPPPVELPPVLEEVSPVASPVALGINAGGWSTSVEVPDVLKLGGTVRLDSPSGSLAAYESKGIRVIADLSGPYSSSGVSGLNRQAYIERVVALVKANPNLYAVEVLNEPGGSWFWGSSSESAANREAYAHLLIEVHAALVANFTRRPLELCSFDGGHLDSDAWGEGWSKVSGALAACDGVTNHPYGGTGTRSTAILGRRSVVEHTEALTHKPVYITEVGFPTAGPTGDSLKYTEAEQAQAYTGFVSWAESTGYIAAVTFFGYRDEKEGGGYGIETHAGAHKLAYAALEAATH